MGVKRVSETEKTFDLKTGIFCHFGSVLGMSLKNVTSLGLNFGPFCKVQPIKEAKAQSKNQGIFLKFS